MKIPKLASGLLLKPMVNVNNISIDNNEVQSRIRPMNREPYCKCVEDPNQFSPNCAHVLLNACREQGSPHCARTYNPRTDNYQCDCSCY